MSKIRKNMGLRMGLITIGLAIIAASINLFFAPHGVAAGGATGMAIIVQEVMGVPTYITTLGINMAMIALASFLLTRATTTRILYGSFMLPVLMAIIPSVKIVQDRTLAVMVGSVTIAVGFTIMYAMDGSSGGTTVPPLIFKRHFGIKPATSLFITDIVVSLLNIPVSGLEAFILALFSLGITNVAMNYIQTGLDRKRMLHVISADRMAEIRTALRNILAGSVRTVQVSGREGDWGNDVLLVVMDQTHYKTVIEIIRGIDANALVIAGEVAEVHDGL